MCWTWTAKLLSIEWSLFVWNSSDQKNTTGPDAEHCEVDVITDIQSFKYNLMNSFDQKNTAGLQDRSRFIDIIKDTNGLIMIQ